MRPCQNDHSEHLTILTVSIVRFCLLEQYLPDSAEHPFAQKMIEHFRKLNTPLQSILRYPKLQDQERRFVQAGWSSVTTESLWDLWCDSSFTSPVQKKLLEVIEPFDEWEEFVLFASHYFLLVAKTKATDKLGSLGTNELPKSVPGSKLEDIGSDSASITIHVDALSCGVLPSQRRFGALFEVSPHVFGFHGGLGAQRRSNTTDKLILESSPRNETLTQSAEWQNGITDFVLPSFIEPRMSHTISKVEDGRFLLVGGRTSPNRPLKDCWYFSDGWQRVHDLPLPLFRHSAVGIFFGLDDLRKPGVLVYGGKTLNNQISQSWLLWHESTGWKDLGTCKTMVTPIFGASMASTGYSSGILVGGMTEECTMSSEIWQWSLRSTDVPECLDISRGKLSGNAASRSVGRLGARLASSSQGCLLIGGVGNGLVNHQDDFVLISKSDTASTKWSVVPVHHESQSARSLLVGHSALALPEGFLIVGGGAVCFSFGIFWNRAPMFCSPSQLEGQSKAKHLSVYKENTDTKEMSETPSTNRNMDNPRLPNAEAATVLPHEGGQGRHAKTEFSARNSAAPSHSVVHRLPVRDASGFTTIQDNRKPVVLTGVDIGPCTAQWTLAGLKAKIGAEREVVVHEAADGHMNFLGKNFVYTKKLFRTFIDEISQGSKQYLRSLSVSKPSSKAAELESDFPELASSFALPSQLDVVNENKHSSVLRISGPVSMWLHYDVRLFAFVVINLTVIGHGKRSMPGEWEETNATVPTI